MSVEQNKREISIKVHGLDKHGGDVRLSVFRDKLDALVKALNEAERQVASVGRAKSNFKITDLHYGSAVAKAEAFEEGEYFGSIEAIGLLEEVISTVDRQAEDRLKVRSALYRGLQEICRGDGETSAGVDIRFGADVFRMDGAFHAKAQKYLDRKYFAHGEIKGRIEKINIHNKFEFVLYPKHGDSVTCTFKPGPLLKQIKDAVGKMVIAVGELEFIGSDVEPSSAHIMSIDVAPDGYRPPGYDEFLGCAPSLSGDMESDEFIRKMRGDWDEH